MSPITANTAGAFGDAGRRRSVGRPFGQVAALESPPPQHARAAVANRPQADVLVTRRRQRRAAGKLQRPRNRNRVRAYQNGLKNRI